MTKVEKDLLFFYPDVHQVLQVEVADQLVPVWLNVLG